MNIFTSYFKRAQSLDPEQYLVVSISRFPPRSFRGVRCYEFAPSANLLMHYKRGISWDNYCRRFKEEVLGHVNVREVFSSLAKITKGRDIVLCCFESDPLHCHRRLICDYVLEHYGYRIVEI